MKDKTTVTEELKKRITIVLEDEVHAAGKKLANEDRRDFSAELATLIEQEQARRSARKEGAAA